MSNSYNYNGKYFTIQDLNSKNGTFVDGKKTKKGARHKAKEGAVISLAKTNAHLSYYNYKQEKFMAVVKCESCNKYYNDSVFDECPYPPTDGSSSDLEFEERQISPTLEDTTLVTQPTADLENWPQRIMYIHKIDEDLLMI